jgi:hypothetical protein
MKAERSRCITKSLGWGITHLSPLLLLLAAHSSGLVQLTIANPKHLDLPLGRAKVLLAETCRVVAEEFHIRNSSDIEYSLTLVLGERDEGYGIDKQGNITLYLHQWSDRKFVVWATRLAIQSLANRDRGDRLAKEILKRADRILPIPKNALGHDGFPGPASPTGTGPDCISALRDEPCSTRDAERNHR